MHKLGIFPLMALALCARVDAHPGSPPIPPPDVLATVPGLTPAQQATVRKIMIERRDALEAVEEKTHSDMETLHKRARDEHERIEEANADKLRKALGDEEYLRLAQWQHEGRGPGPMGAGPMGHGGPRGHGPAGPGEGAGPNGHERGDAPPPPPGKAPPLAQVDIPDDVDVDGDD